MACSSAALFHHGSKMNTGVFFNFIAGIEELSERLDQNGVDYACMTGSTRDRKSIVERFQNDPQCLDE